MLSRSIAILLFAAGGLAACGDTTAERAIYGGAAGAGTAAVLNGNVLAGAAVGAGGNLLYCEKYPERC